MSVDIIPLSLNHIDHNGHDRIAGDYASTYVFNMYHQNKIDFSVPTHCKVYSIQHYVIQVFLPVSSLWNEITEIFLKMRMVKQPPSSSSLLLFGRPCARQMQVSHFRRDVNVKYIWQISFASNSGVAGRKEKISDTFYYILLSLLANNKCVHCQVILQINLTMDQSE
jgi:hypothetical protein